VWLNYQGTQVLAAPEQLRFATPDEVTAWQLKGDTETSRALRMENKTRMAYVDARWKASELQDLERQIRPETAGLEDAVPGREAPEQVGPIVGPERPPPEATEAAS